MRIIFDTNVFIDVLLRQEPFYEKSYQVINLCREKKMRNFYQCFTVSKSRFLRPHGKAAFANKITSCYGVNLHSALDKDNPAYIGESAVQERFDVCIDISIVLLYHVPEVMKMMYPFLTLDDETEIVHSEMLDNNEVKVYVEKPDDKDCFHHMICYLPAYRLEDVVGFNENEVARYLSVIRSTAHLIMEFSRSGGIL